MLRKTAKAVRTAVVEGLSPHIDWVHPITHNKGREFADHEGAAAFQWKFPCDPSDMTYFRKRIGSAGL